MKSIIEWKPIETLDDDDDVLSELIERLNAAKTDYWRVNCLIVFIKDSKPEILEAIVLYHEAVANIEFWFYDIGEKSEYQYDLDKVTHFCLLDDISFLEVDDE